MCRYGNQMQDLPEVLLGLPSLKALWLESNPLGKAGNGNSAGGCSLPLGPALRNVGLDQHQVTCSLFALHPPPLSPPPPRGGVGGL